MSLLLINPKGLGKKKHRKLSDKRNWAKCSELMNPGEACTSISYAILTHFKFVIQNEANVYTSLEYLLYTRILLHWVIQN